MDHEELKEIKTDIKELLNKVAEGNEQRVSMRSDLDHLMASFDKHMEEEPAAWRQMHERLTNIDNGLSSQIHALDDRVSTLERTKTYVEAYAKGATKGTTMLIGGAITVVVASVIVLVYKLTGVDLGVTKG